MRRDSPQQLTIYDAIKNTTQNVCVLATAGSGKTTTILKGLHYIPRHHKAVFLSFSKSIIEELRSKVPMHIGAATLHSEGFAMIRRYYRGRSFKVINGAEETGKYLRFAMAALKKAKGSDYLDKKEYRTAAIAAEICDYARMTLTPFTKEDLPSMCAHFNIDFDENTVQLAIDLLKDSLKVGKKYVMLDFIDMIYWPAVTPQMVDVKYNTIFLDEAQDTNAAQLSMIEKMLGKDGRLIAVGDDFQCIYGFSGADINAFKRIRERPNTITLPLSVSYRCSKAVVIKAQTINPEINYFEEAVEGVERGGVWTEITENDIVLSRTTKPLIDLYFKLLESAIRSRVVGKEFEKGLASLADVCLSTSKEGTSYNLQMKLDELSRKLKEDGVKKPSEHSSYISLEEKVQIINLILNKVESTDKLLSTIHDMFDERKQACRLMTIHRSKGLENERVFVIENVGGQPLMPSKWAKQPWETTQERNLQFVAFTRAKSELVFINLENV